MRRKISYLIPIIVIALAAGASQQPLLSDIPVVDGEKLLNEKYHTPLTREALLSALYDSDSSVRVLAASKLAAAGQKDVVPFILAALERESVPGARMTLALIAARLREPAGIVALEGMCGNLNWDSGLRMSAAQTMDQLNRDDCLPDILSFLSAPDDNQAAIMALNSLHYHHDQASAEQIQEIRRFVPTFLKNADPMVRVYASEVLGKFGDSSSALDLRNALAIEHVESAMDAMSAALSVLEKKPREP